MSHWCAVRFEALRSGRPAADTLPTQRPWDVMMILGGLRNTKLPPPRIPQRRAAKNDRPLVWSGPLAVEYLAWHTLRGVSRLSLSGVDISRWLTEWKRTPGHTWLADVPATCLTQCLRDQDRAFVLALPARDR